MAVVRAAVDGDMAAVAALRWRWLVEDGGTPAVTREEFLSWFAGWARAHASSHRCLVVVDDEAVIGMGWLAVVQRVPTPSRRERVSGDIQSVYLVPERRNAGLGGELVDALVVLARELGLDRVTVHSSPGAVSVYSRRGFRASDGLLQIAPTR